MPEVVPDVESPQALPLMLRITGTRSPRACQFKTTRESGSDTGSDRKRMASMKL